MRKMDTSSGAQWGLWHGMIEEFGSIGGFQCVLFGLPSGDLTAMIIDGKRHIYILVGGLEHEFYFSIDWECHHPN